VKIIAHPKTPDKYTSIFQALIQKIKLHRTRSQEAGQYATTRIIRAGLVIIAAINTRS